MFAAQAIDPIGTPPRTRAFISMVTAAGAFRAGNLDEALAHATNAVSLTGSLQSSRYMRYLTDFHESLTERHSANPAVRQFAGLLDAELIRPYSCRVPLEGAPRRSGLAPDRLHARLILTCDVG